MTPSPGQEAAVAAVRAWLRDGGQQVFRLFGYAGTGKTSLAQLLASEVRGRVLYGSFTGKAALVMQKRGCWGAKTIHSLIYKIRDAETNQPEFDLDPESPVRGASLVVIDECSMVDLELGNDLLSFGAPVLVLGDPAQLPPVKAREGGGGFFTEAQPDAMLTEVHRQAAGSPIIDLATQVRKGERLRRGDYGEVRVLGLDEVQRDDAVGADQILVGRNRTRTAYNNRIRELRGLPAGLVQEGDRLVCLRNDRELGLLNGGLWTCSEVVRRSHNVTTLRVVSDDFPGRSPVRVTVRNEFFDGTDTFLDWREKRGTQEFTYGYALTVHKAQGSQWPSTYLLDESAAFGAERHRWLYTGLTRAAERAVVVL